MTKRLGLISALLLLWPGGALWAQRDRITGRIENSRAVVLKNHVHPRAQARDDQGAVDASLPVSLTLLLRLSDRQQADLDQLLEAQQNPTSAEYHRWLTPEQYANRFGLSRNDIARTREWLAAQGFAVHQVSRSRNTIAFSGTAGQVQDAFHTEMRRYRVDGESHIANRTAPSLPAALAGVVSDVWGLHDFHLKPGQHLTPIPGAVPGAVSPNFTNGSQHYLAPNDLATIYDLQALYSQGIDGTGQKIVIVGESAILAGDMAAFRTAFGLPAKAPQIILVPNYPDPGISSETLQEANLDLQWAGAIARNASLIYVYSSDVMVAMQYAISNNVAPVISMSFGGCERFNYSSLGFLRSLAQQANAQGITWIASSGDSGSAGCDVPNLANATQGLAVNVPAAIPEVTAVGGTEFRENGGTYWSSTNSATRSSALSYIPEIVWNDSARGTGTNGGLWAGGGGKSSFYPKPSWQAGAGVPNDGFRDLPDVSLSSSGHDGYIICSNGNCVNGGFTNAGGSFYVSAGTSAAAPVFAGMVALVQQYLVSHGIQTQPALGNINPTLYKLAANAPAVYHDTIAGSNAVPCRASTSDCVNGGLAGYSAGEGYDLATGWGSVDGFNLATLWSRANTSTGTTTVTSPPVLPPNADYSSDGKPDLLWQNEASRQAQVWYLGGAGGITLLGANSVTTSDVSGWHIVGTGDFNGDGKPDLVWQHDVSHQASVWYMGGPQGNTLLGWSPLTDTDYTSWHIVAVGDFNGDGKPDLVWQHVVTHQATVWYMGGPQGSTYLGWNPLTSSDFGSWQIVGVVDFNGDGRTDLVWQNITTREVSVWYMGGPQGNVYLGWSPLSGPAPGMTVAGAGDFNGDGKPDLVWQNDATRQASIWYMGGTMGNTFLSSAAIAGNGMPGWRLLVIK